MTRLLRPDAEGIAAAAAALRAGELVAFPTETVYGLGADALDPAAVARIFAAKGRPADHPVIVHVPDRRAAAALVGPLDAAARRDVDALTDAFWPGPLTLVVPRAPGVPDAVTGGQDTVGLRCPSDPVARSLLEAFGGPVAAPSANPFGGISPTEPQHVLDDLGGRVAVVLERGEASPRVGIESTIVALGRGDVVLLRPGSVRREQIEAAIGREVHDPDAPAPRASGRLERHYAPSTPARYLPAAALASAVAERPDAALLAWGPRPEAHRGPYRRLPADPDDAGRVLYATLRELDRADAPALLVESVPDGARWDALRDRLRKATAPAEPAADRAGEPTVDAPTAIEPTATEPTAAAPADPNDAAARLPDPEGSLP